MPFENLADLFILAPSKDDVQLVRVCKHPAQIRAIWYLLMQR